MQTATLISPRTLRYCYYQLLPTIYITGIHSQFKTHKQMAQYKAPRELPKHIEDQKFKWFVYRLLGSESPEYHQEDIINLARWPAPSREIALNPQRNNSDEYRLFAFLVRNGVSTGRATAILMWWSTHTNWAHNKTINARRHCKQMADAWDGPRPSKEHFMLMQAGIFQMESRTVVPGFPNYREYQAATPPSSPKQQRIREQQHGFASDAPAYKFTGFTKYMTFDQYRSLIMEGSPALLDYLSTSEENMDTWDYLRRKYNF